MCPQSLRGVPHLFKINWTSLIATEIGPAVAVSIVTKKFAAAGVRLTALDRDELRRPSSTADPISGLSSDARGPRSRFALPQRTVGLLRPKEPPARAVGM